jgi:hypothetical protein
MVKYSTGVIEGEGGFITMSDFTIWIILTITLSCMAFNICWWLYGRTLSEAFPAFIVLPIMLISLYGFFTAFHILLRDVCNHFISPRWGYVTEYNEFVPFAGGIAHIIAGLFTIGAAILIYKDEGKVENSKFAANREKQE